uniref:Uncharacterized protein n=1 Tax=Anguilla anguilla TaxID=7936 RepID=A0A0E9W2B6_ANGAN
MDPPGSCDCKTLCCYANHRDKVSCQ